jgi:CelD/BcsL family acetyltransferase involved in cellulose biosynthesis
MTKETSYQVLTLRDLEALTPWLTQWQQLAQNAPQQLPQLSPAWVLNYFNYMRAPTSSWAVYLVVDAQQKLLALIPFVIRKTHAGLLTQLATPWDYHTRSGDCLFDVDAPANAVELIFAEIKQRYGQCWVYDSKGVHADSVTVERIRPYIAAQRIEISPEEIGNVIELTAESYEAYFAALSKNMRQNLNACRRKLTQLPNFEERFIEGKAVDEKMLEQFFVLEGSGWKGQDGTAINLHQALLDFYCHVAQSAAQQGNFELHGLFADNKLISAHFVVVCGNNLVLQKIAYDENYSKLSPGGVLLLSLIKREYDNNKRRSIDLVGRDDWKERWNVRQIHYRRLQLAGGYLANMLVLVPFRLKNHIKKQLKKFKR